MPATRHASPTKAEKRQAGRLVRPSVSGFPGRLASTRMGTCWPCVYFYLLPR